MRIEISPVACFDALGDSWRALEADATELSFFQSWTWVGCLAGERYPDPVLLRAEAPGTGRVVGMALLNRRRGRLCLAESGDARLDAPFVEHNAPLVAAGAAGAAAALLRAAWHVRGTRRLVLGGVPPAVLRAAGGTPLRLQERIAPAVDLHAARAAVAAAAAGGGWLGTLGANTRYQIRRSARRYAERGGVPPALARAGSEAEALAWLDRLVALHAETWRARGRPGAFADPFALRFHRALLARAQARGELDMLRAAAGGAELGYLYNFRLRGRVYAYQSGFDYAGAGPHGKPGLTCHALAVERALAAGERSYDFLAGADRYKLSLANGTAPLLWAELVPAWSPLGLAARLGRALRRRLRRGAPG